MKFYLSISKRFATPDGYFIIKSVGWNPASGRKQGGKEGYFNEFYCDWYDKRKEPVGCKMWTWEELEKLQKIGKFKEL